MILLIIKMIFLTTLWTLGWKVIISEGMLLEKIGSWGDKKAEQGYKIVEGLITCPWCVPNIHGLLFVWPLAFGMGIMPLEFSWKYVFAYPFCVAGSSFVSGYVWGLFLMVNAKRDYFKSNSFNEERFNHEA